MPYGFVDMATKAEADLAISKLNGSMFEGSKIVVQYSDHSSRPKPSPLKHDDPRLVAVWPWLKNYSGLAIPLQTAAETFVNGERISPADKEMLIVMGILPSNKTDSDRWKALQGMIQSLIHSDREQKGVRLFVSHLSPVTTDNTLKTHFLTCGIVLRAEHMKKDGNLIPSGIVTMATKKEADEAIAHLNGSIVDGNRINVRLWSDAPPSPVIFNNPRLVAVWPELRNASLVSSSLNAALTPFLNRQPITHEEEKNLMDLVCCQIEKRTKRSGMSCRWPFARRAGIVPLLLLLLLPSYSSSYSSFTSYSAFSSSFSCSLHGPLPPPHFHQYTRRSLSPPVPPSSDVTLRISNLSSTVTTDQLLLLFSPYGAVLHIFLRIDSSQPAGSGFVTMGSLEEASNAIAHLNRLKVGGKQIRVELDSSKHTSTTPRPLPVVTVRVCMIVPGSCSAKGEG